jgi:hypothetical protein
MAQTEFRGATELEIESEFLRWRAQYIVYEVVRHPIERVPRRVQDLSEPPMALSDAFFQIVEYQSRSSSLLPDIFAYAWPG